MRRPLLALLLATGCAAPARDVARDGERWVRLVERDDGAAHEHPRPMAREALAASLTALECSLDRFVVLEERLPVFDVEEVAWLAPALHEALQRARPTERIEFQVATRRLGLAYWGDERTAGAAYVEGGRLQLAFGAVRYRPKVASPELGERESQERTSDPFRDAPAGLRLLEGPGVTLRAVDDEDDARDNWVELDLERAPALETPPPAGPAPPQPVEAPAAPVAPDTVDAPAPPEPAERPLPAPVPVDVLQGPGG